MKCMSLTSNFLHYTNSHMCLTGVMRVLLTAKATLAAEYERLLLRLVTILSAICKNPSNPNFDQYIFESISALIR